MLAPAMKLCLTMDPDVTDTETILLVNPEPALLRLTRAILPDALLIDSARTPEEIEDALQQQSYRAALVNFCPIERRSWDLLDALCGGSHRLPVVVLTTDATHQTRARVLGYGVASMLYMPFAAEALRQAIACAALDSTESAQPAL